MATAHLELIGGANNYCTLNPAMSFSDYDYPKMFLKFPLTGDLVGATVTSATVGLYMISYQYSTTLTLPVKTTTSQWNSSTEGSTLNSFPLSATLSSNNWTTVLGYKTYNVTGNESSGVYEACINSRPYVTFVFHVESLLPNVTGKSLGLWVGTDNDNGRGNYKTFEYPDRAGGTWVNLPYLDITYTPVSLPSRRNIHSGTAGTLLF